MLEASAALDTTSTYVHRGAPIGRCDRRVGEARRAGPCQVNHQVKGWEARRADSSGALAKVHTAHKTCGASWRAFRHGLPAAAGGDVSAFSFFVQTFPFSDRGRGDGPRAAASRSGSLLGWHVSLAREGSEPHMRGRQTIGGEKIGRATLQPHTHQPIHLPTRSPPPPCPHMPTPRGPNRDTHNGDLCELSR
jgi:hypothetical protein